MNRTLIKFTFRVAIAVVFIAVTRKYGFLGGETLDFYNMSYVKDQVEGVKLSVAQLHTAKKDIEDVYTKMTDMLGSIKQLNEGIPQKNMSTPEQSYNIL